jgi:hypothetical protein
MKKLIVSVLALGILLPTAAFAISPGRGPGDPNCVIWRQGMSDTAITYQGQGICNQWDDKNARLVQLETIVEFLQSNSQAPATATTPTPVYVNSPYLDQTTIDRISALESEVKTLQGIIATKVGGLPIAGCGSRTVGFSVTSGQSCIGNVPAK